MPESVVLLHGFAGTRRAWDGVLERLDPERYLSLALDLPGHGLAFDAPAPITFAACVQSVLALAPASFALCGYSLGGRVALQVALAAPERVSALVLVSTSAGIEDPGQRAARRESDGLLARELEERPFERFLERWRGQPLFADEPARVRELARADQLRNRPRALAAVLRGLGTGEMEPLWDRLAELEMPVAVAVGKRDEKFLVLGERMAAALPRGRLHVLPGGHRLPLESPAELARVIDGATDRPQRRTGRAR